MLPGAGTVVFRCVQYKSDKRSVNAASRPVDQSRPLRPGGTYIEGDTTDKTQAEEGLYWYNRWIAKLPKGDEAEWNYDINLCPDTNMRLLNNAGFSEIKHTWSKGTLAVLVARM